MSDAPDLNDLAKRYIDLWQEHLSDLAADGDVTDTIARTIELMSGSASAIAAFNMQMTEAALKQTGSTDEGTKSDGGQPDPKTGQSAPSGTTPPAPAHGGSNPDVDELTRRVAKLEKRLNQLESPVGKPRNKSAKKSAKS